MGRFTFKLFIKFIWLMDGLKLRISNLKWDQEQEGTQKVPMKGYVIHINEGRAELPFSDKVNCSYWTLTLG